MRTVELGQDIVFSVTFRDSNEELYDPEDVNFSIVKHATNVVFGPYLYSDDEVTKVSTGVYEYTFTAPQFLTPGFLTGKWSAEVEGEMEYEYEEFGIVDLPVQASQQLDAPRLYGNIRESFLYNEFGIGLTDTIFLVGHATGLTINDPYQVVRMQDAVNILGADSDSPLFRALLEAYNSGARDIWLVAAAPMSEYVPDLENRFTGKDEWGGLNFYERYKERLDATYQILQDWDYPEIIVPLEAPFYDAGDVDFLTQLVDHCAEAFVKTGAPRLGLIGTRVENWTAEDITAMATDPRLNEIEDGGKFVMVIVGEGTTLLPQGLNGYRVSPTASAAALLSRKRVHEGLTYQRLPYTVSLIGRALKQEEINLLCRARLNPLIKSKRGKRGGSFQSLIATDNTLTPEGSDYWSIATTRLVSRVMRDVRGMGRRTIGTIDYVQFKLDVRTYFANLVTSDLIKSFELNIERDPVQKDKIYVDVKMSPYLAVREIFFTVECGTGG